MTVERLSTRPRRTGTAACPICGSPVRRDFRPFCSRRCKEIDLGRWFSGAYAVPAEEALDGADPEEPTAAGTARDADDSG